MPRPNVYARAMTVDRLLLDAVAECHGLAGIVLAVPEGGHLWSAPLEEAQLRVKTLHEILRGALSCYRWTVVADCEDDLKASVGGHG